MDFSKVGKNKVAQLPAKKPVLDLSLAKQQIQVYKTEIGILLQQAMAHEITDDLSAKMGVEMTAQVKGLLKKLEEHRKEIIEEPNRFVKAVNSFTKEFTDQLLKIEANLKTKIGQFQYQRELARRDAERQAQEEAAKLQKKLDKEAKEKGIESVTVPIPVLPKDDSMVRSDSGSAYTRRVWKGEITDTSILPHEFWEPSQKKVDEAVKAGLREIPGVRIWEDIQVGIRT